MLYFLLLVCFLMGYVLQQPRLLGDAGTPVLLRLLNRWILWFALPALILLTVPALNFSTNHLFAAAVPWVVFVSLYLLLQQFKFGFDRDQRLILMLLLPLGNTAFLGVPLIRYVLGEDFTLAALVYDQFGSFLVLSTVAAGLITAHQKTQAQKPALQRLVKIVCFPPFLTLVFALLLPADFPRGLIGEVSSEYFQTALAFASSTLMPLAMLLVGLQFRFRFEPGAFRLIRWVVGLKMLLLPALVLFVARLFGVDDDVAVASVIQTAMPPMITGVVLLTNANIGPRLATSVLAVCTLAAALSLPLWFYLIAFL